MIETNDLLIRYYTGVLFHTDELTASRRQF